MGFTSLVLFQNDFLHEIEKDPQWMEKIFTILSSGDANEEANRQLCGRAKVLRVSHADDVTLHTVGSTGTYPLVWEDDRDMPRDAAEAEIRLARKLAEKHGYNLQPKADQDQFAGMTQHEKLEALKDRGLKFVPVKDRDKLRGADKRYSMYHVIAPFTEIATIWQRPGTKKWRMAIGFTGAIANGDYDTLREATTAVWEHVDEIVTEWNIKVFA